ncbi:hypothetical protein AtEden1_Chr1g0038811 [Arabidopsis thaliana]
MATKAISKDYTFASTWKQRAPLTEKQQADIVSLYHGVAERPFPLNLVSLRMFWLIRIRWLFLVQCLAHLHI